MIPEIMERDILRPALEAGAEEIFRNSGTKIHMDLVMYNDLIGEFQAIMRIEHAPDNVRLARLTVALEGETTNPAEIASILENFTREVLKLPD